MKIYRVGEDKLWTNWQSAINSAAAANVKDILVVEVPDDQWKVADRRVESKVRRLNNLWSQLTWDNQEQAELLIAELQRRVAAKSKKTVVDSEKSPLSDEERREAEVMFKLDRLVDAS